MTILSKTDKEAERKRLLENYMSLSYPIELHDEDDGFTALNPDLPGCASYGETADEAVKKLRIVRRLWIEGKLEAGFAVPRPTETQEFSGKLLLRIPKDLHRTLHDEAAKQGASLNQYLGHVIARRHSTASNSAAEIATSVIANLRALLTTQNVVANQKALYGHQFTGKPSVFIYDGPASNFDHTAYFMPIGEHVECIIAGPGHRDKAAYAEAHSLPLLECSR